jgi:Protein of Unknown function (DUF2784)
VLYGLLADLVVVVHLGFIAFVAVGGFLAWRWPRLLWLHVPAIIYALVIVAVGFDCPLTPLEKHLRHAAGQAGYAKGFVDHYLTGVLYPDRLLVLVQTLVAAAVITSYAGLLFRHGATGPDGRPVSRWSRSRRAAPWPAPVAGSRSGRLRRRSPTTRSGSRP